VLSVAPLPGIDRLSNKPVASAWHEEKKIFFVVFVLFVASKALLKAKGQGGRRLGLSVLHV
jgi:hypothetical protein